MATLKKDVNQCKRTSTSSAKPVRSRSSRSEETMSELKQCKQCTESIETGDLFVRFRNPDPSQPPLVFHHRGRGDCYWRYLRDQVLKVQGQPRPTAQAA
jgi:hypothetical protein